MLEHAVNDRLSSKKAARTLVLTVEYHRELWHTWLSAFRQDTLSVKDARSSTPTGSEIERFLTAMDERLKPCKQGLLAVGTLTVGLSSLIKAAVFYHPGFSLNRHERSRVASTIQTLVLLGKLTNQIKSEKQWVGATVLEQKVQAIYEDALKGIVAWERTSSQSPGSKGATFPAPLQRYQGCCFVSSISVVSICRNAASYPTRAACSTRSRTAEDRLPKRTKCRFQDAQPSRSLLSATRSFHRPIVTRVCTVKLKQDFSLVAS
jgi:hypothetical protein